MRKKFFILITICLIVSLGYINFPKEPRIISNITTMDTAYLTILVDKREIKNIKKLEIKLLKMCKEDQFESMKLKTEDKELPENLHISVYASKEDLEKGQHCVTFTYKGGMNSPSLNFLYYSSKSQTPSPSKSPWSML